MLHVSANPFSETNGRSTHCIHAVYSNKKSKNPGSPDYQKRLTCTTSSSPPPPIRQLHGGCTCLRSMYVSEVETCFPNNAYSPYRALRLFPGIERKRGVCWAHRFMGKGDAARQGEMISGSTSKSSRRGSPPDLHNKCDVRRCVEVNQTL